MGESISGLSVQAAVFKPRKCAGTKQEGNEGHFNQHGNVVQQSEVLKTVILETGNCNEIINHQTVKNNETVNNNLRIASLNINRGLFNKEERLLNTIEEHELDIIGVSEVDIKDFDETKPFSLEGLNTFFPLQAGNKYKKNSVFHKSKY